MQKQLWSIYWICIFQSQLVTIYKIILHTAKQLMATVLPWVVLLIKKYLVRPIEPPRELFESILTLSPHQLISLSCETCTVSFIAEMYVPCFVRTYYLSRNSQFYLFNYRISALEVPRYILFISLLLHVRQVCTLSLLHCFYRDPQFFSFFRVLDEHLFHIKVGKIGLMQRTFLNLQREKTVR